MIFVIAVLLLLRNFLQMGRCRVVIVFVVFVIVANVAVLEVEDMSWI